MVACCFNWMRFSCRWGILILLLAMPGPLQAQTAAPATEKVDRLIELLADPEVKTWLADQNKKIALATQPASNDVRHCPTFCAPSGVMFCRLSRPCHDCRRNSSACGSF
jgi:hypothetical protein